MSTEKISDLKFVGAIAVLVLLVVALLFGIVYGYNLTRVFNAEQRGKAILAEAESSRKIKVLEAQARKESAALDAAANRLMIDSMGGTEAYLRFLAIDAMRDTAGKGTVVYVPTEAGIPITEAGVRNAIPRAE